MKKIKMTEKDFNELCKNIVNDELCLYKGEGCYEPECNKCWKEILIKYIDIN
ncbi:hypothetical protein [Clostridium perfringens]|uniref:hypothetical protein n=1 Tax=Clostridium perfringens TaxID=1502 RepID=UPI00156EBCD9|nr:hypothetical protein [Clostridium perfringens]MDU7977721.1 hypothetical protein [Clostridioides difficile]MBI6024831.1 hypothetical protein [Clostridium perfringens]MBI6048782.1 hypothetical protein [Clostridium perfringens]MDK0554192.1 hypothetical protein [Clostridium perfringens]MDK0575043.1 hypothetical protein [Clostridium perfringens]